MLGYLVCTFMASLVGALLIAAAIAELSVRRAHRRREGYWR
jgi:hypothetical protein